MIIIINNDAAERRQAATIPEYFDVMEFVGWAKACPKNNNNEPSAIFPNLIIFGWATILSCLRSPLCAAAVRVHRVVKAYVSCRIRHVSNATQNQINESYYVWLIGWCLYSNRYRMWLGDVRPRPHTYDERTKWQQQQFRLKIEIKAIAERSKHEKRAYFVWEAHARTHAHTTAQHGMVFKRKKRLKIDRKHGFEYGEQ